MATSPQLMEAFKNFSKNRNNPNAPTLLEEGVNMATQPPAMPQAPDVSPQAQNVPSMVKLLQRQTLPQFSELEAEANQRLANMPAVDFGGTGRQDGTQAYPFSAPQQAGPQSTFQPMGGYGFIPQSQIPTPPARQEGSSFMGGVDNFLGTFMRAATPEQELGYTPPSMGDVLATAGIRSAGGGIIGDPGRTEARTGPMPITLQPTQTPSATTQEPPAVDIPTPLLLELKWRVVLDR